jgi:fatty-acid desaturase
VGRVEWFLFVLMYALTTVGIGLTVHRMLVHRSSSVMRPSNFSSVPSVRWHVRGRF